MTGKLTAPKPARPAANEPFALSPGQSAMVGGVVIRFVDVPADSRCPSNVVCFWEGDGMVRVSIDPAPSRASRTAALHTRLEPRAIAIGSDTLELVRLDPYPARPGQIPQAEYVATLVVR